MSFVESFIRKKALNLFNRFSAFFYKYLYCLNFNIVLYLFINLDKEKLVNCFNFKKEEIKISIA
ncbi:hypothetical protein F1Z29_05870 [Clostridium perfringens]|nr:hypothetical protein [Clostridium perfringens]